MTDTNAQDFTNSKVSSRYNDVVVIEPDCPVRLSDSLVLNT